MSFDSSDLFDLNTHLSASMAAMNHGFHDESSERRTGEKSQTRPPEYQYTKRVEGETATVVVGPFRSMEETRAAIVRDLMLRRPRVRQRRAERFAARLYATGGEVEVGPFGPAYSIQLRPHMRPEDAERVRREDAEVRYGSGVALVHLDTLLAVMAERVPEYLRGKEREAYAEALCDIPIHVRDATVEHDSKSGQLEWKQTPIRVDVARTLGNRWDRTGVWSEKGGSS